MTSLLSEPHLDVAAPGSARPAAGSGVVDFRLDNGLTRWASRGSRISSNI
jgi:hypothetical protein